ncbi:MAG TPA: penicillin-binding protein 2 [Candidatus Eisenbacteria bacterium]|nr:penicillin-binding protein 2 [Candidatus Eisenbacteria bacterium]
MRWRYLATVYIFVFLFLAVSLRLFYWQVVKAEELTSMGQSQYGSLISIEPKRGDIQTRDGFPLVTNRLSYLVFANPKEIKDADKVGNVLSPLLDIASASLSARLTQNGFWVSLKSGIDTKTKDAIDALHIPGVGFEEDYARLYPEASMAATLLGFVGKDEIGNAKGYFGLEGYYDRQLKGRYGQAVEIHDALGRPILSQLSGNGTVQDGRTLVLTIDRSLQFLVDQKLKEGVENFGATSGMIGIMDPKNGDILAMANYPSFDENTFWQYDTSLYRNPFITDLYEPGSTIKPLVMAGALNNGLVKPDTTCPICSGPVKVGDYDIHTWNNEYFPNISMKDIIRHSDNTGMVYVSEKMGLDKMVSNFENFGLTNTTGIDLQGETNSHMLDRKTWYPIDVATSAFGQGISVTALQLLDGFAALANNGVRMQPRVVDKIVTSDGETIPIPPKELSHPVSSTTAKVMTEMLVYTVNKGEASFARIKGYRIAGKTGTASIPVAGHYDPTQTIASFIGYAPADNPKFVMLVVFNKPTASIYGAETAAPTFFSITRHILSYYGIAPTENE